MGDSREVCLEPYNLPCLVYAPVIEGQVAACPNCAPHVAGVKKHIDAIQGRATEMLRDLMEACFQYPGCRALPTGDVLLPIIRRHLAADRADRGDWHAGYRDGIDRRHREDAEVERLRGLLAEGVEHVKALAVLLGALPEGKGAAHRWIERVEASR